MTPGKADTEPVDLTPRVAEIARLVGMTDLVIDTTENPDGKGPARFTRPVTGRINTSTPYALKSIET
ncbi:MAG: hypothetical protein IIC49_01350 [Planctomycetes bacterium]|nr:hypothetical protein [Planctomycetota bacterium]